MPNILLNIFVSINGMEVVDGTIDGDDIARTLKMIDEVLARMGLSHDEARKRMLNRLETYEPRVRERHRMWRPWISSDVFAPDVRESMLQTALWIACRGENGRQLEEVLRRDMGVECRFRRNGSQASLKSITRSGEKATRVMQRWQVHDTRHGEYAP
jgi:hypothetical protein